MNLWNALLVLLVAVLLECSAYSKGKKKGFEQGYCRGRTDANLWWLKVECEVSEARHEIWREDT
jgi:hypothetical protein